MCVRGLWAAVILFFAAMEAQSYAFLANGGFPRQRTKNSKHVLQSVQAPTLEQIHDHLRKYSGLHDDYLYAATLGNEETVPLLLQRFRLDYGPLEPAPPPGTIPGFDCSQVHLVDALRSITNTDQGMYYPRWAAWWEANKGSSQHRWILDGFGAEGLHVVEPLDERFALELIEVMGRGPAYRILNAKRLLAVAPPEQRAGWLVYASGSEQRFRRLGAIVALTQIDTVGHDDLLRKLATDSDLEIRQNAIAALDNRPRVAH